MLNIPVLMLLQVPIPITSFSPLLVMLPRCLIALSIYLKITMCLSHWTWHVCNSISKTILSCRRNASCYVNPPNSWRIVIPSALLRPITEWYHKVLGHVGSSRLYESISIHFYHPGLQNLIDELVSRCDTSQRCL
jgi:hypothetical protein